MAITLDTIINKRFTVVKNGYDNNEVEDFLEEIIDEMSNREAETNQLKEKVEALSRELEQSLTAAEKAADGMTDEYISVEHIMMGLIDKADDTLKKLFRNIRRSYHYIITA